MTTDAPDLTRLAFRPAKTMPEAPHEYVTRTRENVGLYARLFHTIRRDGQDAQWGGETYRYWERDGWKYWAMTDDLKQSRIINRARIADDA